MKHVVTSFEIKSIFLPCRHFFVKLDGVTTGPSSFTGPIGRLAEGPVHELPPRKFKPRDCQQPETLPEAIAEKLGGDQKILRRFVVGAKTGES